VAEFSPPSSPSSAEERAFWEREFHDDPEPPRRARPHELPRREQRLARVPDGPLTRVVDRLHDWRADARFGVVVLVLVAVVAGVVWYRVGVGGASAGESAAPRAATTTTGSTTSLGEPTPSTAAKGTPVRIAVHVAGAVTHPGVVELHNGARVIDAVEAVGGALADGDLDRLNLAAKVTDGERVYVAKVGQADPGVLGSDGGTGATGTGGGAIGSGGVGAGSKVNLNTATQAQLEELPGIGPTYAQSIIAERERRGGFTSVNDLRSVRGIGDKRFAELAPLVTV
jgi:competence protein ComEA